MSESRLQAAVRAVKAGQFEIARTILAKIVLEEPDNVHAWLWLSFSVKEADKKLDCLKQVLRIQPGNQTALKEVERLKVKLNTFSSDIPVSEDEVGAHHQQDDLPETTLPVPADLEQVTKDAVSDSVPSTEFVDAQHPPVQEKTKDQSNKKRPRRGLWMLIGLILGSLCIILAFLSLIYLPELLLPPPPGERLPAGAMGLTKSPVTPSPVPATETPTVTATQTPTYTPTFTHTPSATLSPSISPSMTAMGGSGEVAFVSDQTYNSEIFLMNVDTGNLINVSKAPTFDSMPVWSPDGKSILFASERDSPCGGQGECSKVFRLDLEDEMVRNLFEFDGVQVLPEDWLPDGRIAVNVNRAKEIVGENQNQEYDLYLIEPDLSEPKLWREEPGWEWLQDLSGNLFPKWSPDGEMILVSLIDSGSDRTDLLLVNGDGSDPQSIVPDSLQEGKITQPCWSPDAQQIAFVYSLDEGEDSPSVIYLMNIDLSGLKALTASGQASHPSWSPDGKLIAYASNINEGWDIFLIDVEQGSVTQLTVHTGQDFWPVWRP